MYRIGQGYDVHPLVEGRPLILGGERIPYDRGLVGHSDADVVLHALGDALLGAASLGDIGEHFPPDDPKWKGADSTDLLVRIYNLITVAGYRVVNCDLTVIAQEPSLHPYKDSIRDRIADLLGVESSDVAIKATSHEGLGALGRGEGIAALAVALLEKS